MSVDRALQGQHARPAKDDRFMEKYKKLKKCKETLSGFLSLNKAVATLGKRGSVMTQLIKRPKFSLRLCRRPPAAVHSASLDK
jgi:hypothetical protein